MSTNTFGVISILIWNNTNSNVGLIANNRFLSHFRADTDNMQWSQNSFEHKEREEVQARLQSNWGQSLYKRCS